MYLKEEREKAIKLYIKYNKCASDVIHKLGYPDRSTLVKVKAARNDSLHIKTQALLAETTLYFWGAWSP